MKINLGIIKINQGLLLGKINIYSFIMKKNINKARLKPLFYLITIVVITATHYRTACANELFYDLTGAKIVIPKQSTEIEQAAIAMFVDEVLKRTNIKYSIISHIPDPSIPIIVMGSYETVKNDSLLGPRLKELKYSSKDGYSILDYTKCRNAPTILVLGNDSRGMLFGVGCLLRKLTLMPPRGVPAPENFPKDWQAHRTFSMIPGRIEMSNKIFVENSYPIVPIRGHQLGYRPKVNSYDGFDESMYEQYIRDLIVFGTNAIELMPPNTDDASYSPMFPKPQLELTNEVSKILDKYGMEVWMWYPLMFGDYTIPENFQNSLEEAEKTFQGIHKIDALFIPGGDPGHTPPKVLFEYLKGEKYILNKYHPEAEIWVSPQGFSVEWFNEFIELLKGEPEWLTGVVHGPWVRMNVDSLRKIIPEKYQIRRYPDITHTIHCEYPVPNWDIAYATTLHREAINPRPLDQALIFRSTDIKSSSGFITYSEGVNDDVNKMIWSGLGWDPNADIYEILTDYSRYFIGYEYAYDFANGLLGLEKNWNGPLLSNHSVDINLLKFQQLEKDASPRTRLNWRFQQALYRSYYDAYIRSRLIYETYLENAALDMLRGASEIGSLKAIEYASKILDSAVLNKVSMDLRQRVFELAEALFQSIRMQLSVDKYHAISVGRGANLDLIDEPLNNSAWLYANFERIVKIDTEAERLLELEKIVNWENPGPGGYYIDFGDLSENSHLVRGSKYEDDPGSWHSPFIGRRTGYPQDKGWRNSWKTYIHTLFNYPLVLRFDNLDPKAEYQLKIVYLRGPIKLMADDQYVIHDYFEITPWSIEVRTYDIPQEASNDGKLSLQWEMEPAIGGAGRGNKIGEMWLIKK